MKNEIYRSADFWKSAIMKMPDNSFFELLRCVFGKIKTPFNKQQLLNDLETFLLREDIQKTIASYIDKTDKKIIAAIALFGEPVPGQLENFFSGEYSYAQLQDIIVNLEERFILYRFTEEETRTVQLRDVSGSSRLALNPLLKPVLSVFTADTHALFPVIPQESLIQPAENSIVINDIILAALYSFVSRRSSSFYKSEGVIRKRIIDEGKILFPNLELENILGALQVLGLFYAEENILVPDKKYFNDFGLLAVHERMEYFSAALLVYGEMTVHDTLASKPFPAARGTSPQETAVFEIIPPLFRARIHEIVDFIHVLLNSIKPKFLYQEKILARIAEVLKARTGTSINTELLFETLEKTGLVIQLSKGIKQAGEITQISIKNENTPVIVFETGSSILVYPEINFPDAISLASVLNICETGAVSGSTVVRFELDRDSAVRAFNNNISADDIIELLTRLSGGKKDETLIWNLKDWQQRYNEVSITKGIVLKLSENKRYLTETSPLAAMIIETLAPGLYLLKENVMDDAEDALHKAGIDIISHRNFPRREKKEAVYPVNYFQALSVSAQSDFNSDNVEASLKPENKKVHDGLDAIKSGYRTVLEKMKMGETEKAELSARIDRRLILCERQLKDADIRYEKLEARHLDYAGKQNIAKQAIAGVSSVEVIWSFKGNEERIFGIPRALEKSGKDLILLVDIISNNSREHTSSESSNIRIPLAKISLIRKIKKSIFET